MSFQFSPETLITIAENSIEQKQNEIQILQVQLEDINQKINSGGCGSGFDDSLVRCARLKSGIQQEIETKTNEIRALQEQLPSLRTEEVVRAENIAEQFAPFFTNLTVQIQNLLSPILAPIISPPIEEEVTIMPVEEIPVKRNNTLRNTVIVGLILIGGVLVFR